MSIEQQQQQAAAKLLLGMAAGHKSARLRCCEPEIQPVLSSMHRAPSTRRLTSLLVFLPTAFIFFQLLFRNVYVAYLLASLMVQMVKNLPAVQEIRI